MSKPLMAPTPSSRLARAGGAAALYEAGRQAYEHGRALYLNRLTWTVSVQDDDRIYQDVHDWLLGIMPERTARRLVASTSAGGRGDQPVSEDDDRRPSRLQLTYSDQHPQPLAIDGHRVTVSITNPEASETKSTYREPRRIEFRCRSRAAQQAVIGHLDRIHTVRAASKPVLRMVSQWGGWTRRADLPLRSLDSVILPGDQVDRIVTDLRGFIDAEDRYLRLGIPWHRGYMFHGPPGTGKTSLVKALANEFGLDLWYVSLSDLKEESSLMGLLSEVRPRSMLLLEDIDTVQITHDRNTEQGKISLSSLLNALDGVATPHGLITLMTTNHFDRLDPALTRAGRMDLVEELAVPGRTEVQRLYAHFYGRPIPAELIPDGITQAAAAEVFKRHLTDPDGARTALAATRHQEAHA